MKSSTDAPQVLFGALVSRPEADFGAPPHRLPEFAFPNKAALALVGASALVLLWLIA
jgi:hypothetical protein